MMVPGRKDHRDGGLTQEEAAHMGRAPGASERRVGGRRERDVVMGRRTTSPGLQGCAEAFCLYSRSGKPRGL